MYVIGRFFAPLTGTVLGAAILTVVSGATAQERVADSPQVEEYFRGVAGHFRLPPEEIFILGDWRLPPQEVPALIFVSRRAGVSPEAIAALRRSGRSWAELTRQYDLDSDVYHVDLPPDAGSLARARSLFEGRPPAEWGAIELTDSEIVGLINLKVLSEVLGVPPGRVLEARERAGSYPAAYQRLHPGTNGD